MSEWLLIWILFTHFVADFIFQTRYVAENKSKDVGVLFEHIMIYGGVSTLMIIAALFLSVGFSYIVYKTVAAFVAINMIAHFITDFFTSRATSYLYKQERIHAFFVVIGFDQFLHVVVLILTMRLFSVFI